MRLIREFLNADVEMSLKISFLSLLFIKKKRKEKVHSPLLIFSIFSYDLSTTLPLERSIGASLKTIMILTKMSGSYHFLGLVLIPMEGIKKVHNSDSSYY